jgi:hypothetical protein
MFEPENPQGVKVDAGGKRGADARTDEQSCQWNDRRSIACASQRIEQQPPRHARHEATPGSEQRSDSWKKGPPEADGVCGDDDWCGDEEMKGPRDHRGESTYASRRGHGDPHHPSKSLMVSIGDVAIEAIDPVDRHSIGTQLHNAASRTGGRTLAERSQAADAERPGHRLRVLRSTQHLSYGV